ncbi:mCG145936, partial [Mus musculus]
TPPSAAVALSSPGLGRNYAASPQKHHLWTEDEKGVDVTQGKPPRSICNRFVPFHMSIKHSVQSDGRQPCYSMVHPEGAATLWCIRREQACHVRKQCYVTANSLVRAPRCSHS